MSIIVSNIKLPFTQTEQTAIERALSLCRFRADEVSAAVCRVSIDARRGQIHRVYSVCIDAPCDEEAFAEKLQMPFVRYKPQNKLQILHGTRRLEHRPIVVGLGPAGLFAAYLLAKNGYAPLVIERGDAIDARDQAVERFWKTQHLDTQSNIQFGEGGAGAYSDGKLTTRIGDPLCDTVLETLAQYGAPTEILKQAKPHIGTDVLKNVVRRMREQIVACGGEVVFRQALTGVVLRGDRLAAIETTAGEIACERAVLALGHSARDTFFALQRDGVFFEPKAFSVGVRIEHPQSVIDHALYGTQTGHPLLPPGEYALSRRTDGRACYSFCMCPGGVVVAAQSEENSVVVNGMSYHARTGKNANAALAVSVEPSDYADGTPFGGVALQRRIEQAAFRQTGSYRAPCQRVGDFLEGRASKDGGTVEPTYPIGVVYGEAAASLPPFAQQMLRDSLPFFGRKIKGFDMPDALLTGPETRTSSPVRMTRGEDLCGLQSAGLLPCGEGAGYAGGIMSAAVDGMRCAIKIMEEYAPMEG